MSLDLGFILNVVLAVLGSLFLLSALVFVVSLLWGQFASSKPSAPTLPVISTPPVVPPTTTTVPASMTQWLAPLNALPEGQLLGKAILSEIQQLGTDLAKNLLSALAGKMLAPLLPPSTTPTAPAPAPSLPAPQTVIDNGLAALQNQINAVQSMLQAQQAQLAPLQADVGNVKETLGKLNGTVKVQVDPSQLQARA